MTTVNLATIQALIQKMYSGALANTIIQTSPAYSILKERGKIKVQTRNEIRWQAIKTRYAGITNINDGETLPNSSDTQYADAYLTYKIYIGLLRVGRLAQLGSKNSMEFFSTPQGIDLLAQQMQQVLPQMARQMHLDLVSLDSTSAKSLTSLGDAIAKNDNIYANIDRTTNAFWQPYVNANGGVNRALTEALLRDMHDVLTFDRDAKVSEVWCGLTAFNALEDLLEDRVRIMTPNEYRAGAIRIFWRDVPFVRMPNMDTNAMYWLDFDSDEGIEIWQQHPEDFLTRAEPTNSYDDRISLSNHSELRVHNPFKQGALLDVQ